MENYFRYVGETNRTSLVLSGREGYLNRIIAPSGSDEPFYYSIEGHYGASDHEVFNDWAVGVPAVMLITWPDLYYHTSQDLPNKLDPTQLKRCCVIGAAGAYTIASANGGMASKIAGEVFSNAMHRLSIQMARATDELSKLKEGNFTPGYKKIVGYINSVLLNEAETIETVQKLAANDANLKATIALQISQIKKSAEGMLQVLDLQMKQQAILLKIPAVDLKPDELEKKALAVIPKVTPKVKESDMVVTGSLCRK
jgi:hypothetical protein